MGFYHPLMSNIRFYPPFIETLQVALAGVLLPRVADGASPSTAHGLLIAAATSLLVIGLAFGCHLQGTLPWEAFVRTAAVIVAAVLSFGLIFRSGLNRKAADPSLTVPQMAVATLVMMFAMYSAEAGGGGVFVVVVLMIFLFGVIRLRTMALLRFAVLILVAHAATIMLHVHFRPGIQDLGVRLLQWATLAATLPWFALMGGHIKAMREELRKSNVLQSVALRDARTSEARLAEAQRIARLGSWTFQPSTMAAHWSQEMYRIYGADPTKPVPMGAEFLRRVHPDDQRHYLELIRPAVGSGRGFDSEYRIVLPDGEARWVHVVCEPGLGDDGQTLLLRGTAHDITERKEQESALRQATDEGAAARTNLIDAIEVLPEAFALFDTDDRLTLWNSRYAELFAEFDNFELVAGTRYEDIVRASVAHGESIAPEFANDVEAYIANRVRLHRNPPATREVKIGGDRWLQVSERRTTFGGIVGVRSDITERKELEQRQAMEHAVTRLLAKSETVSETMPQVIRTVCETLGWDCGARWQLNPTDNLLHCVDIWSVATREIAAFSAFCVQQTFAPSTSGLVCRVMLSGQPLWIADVSREPGFKRGAAAAKAGLHGAFAFPIRVGAKLVGAMEFFIRNVRQPNAPLLRVLESIGLQLGQYFERAAAQEELEQRAHYDALTGLPNRSLFNELLTRAWVKARRNGTRLAVLFIDLDGFKAINDRHGHDAGDHLLAKFSKRLKGCLRESDTIARHGKLDTAARLGGDEFVVLIDDVNDVSGLSVLAERILNAATKPFDLAGPQGHVSASIGIGIYPDDGQSVEDLIKAADRAMYAAKQSGRNAYRFHTAESQRQITVVS